MSLERTSGVASVLAGVLPALGHGRDICHRRDGVFPVDRKTTARDTHRHGDVRGRQHLFAVRDACENRAYPAGARWPPSCRPGWDWFRSVRTGSCSSAPSSAPLSCSGSAMPPRSYYCPECCWPDMIGGRTLGLCARIFAQPLRCQRNHRHAVAELCRRVVGERAGVRAMEGSFQPRLAGHRDLSGGGDAAGVVRNTGPSRAGLRRDRGTRLLACCSPEAAGAANYPSSRAMPRSGAHDRSVLCPANHAGDVTGRRTRRAGRDLRSLRHSGVACSRAYPSATGLTGFLVAWLSGHNAFAAIVVSFLIGGLTAAGDSLQLYAKVPAASATILQGLLFATALAVGSLSQRWSASRG